MIRFLVIFSVKAHSSAKFIMPGFDHAMHVTEATDIHAFENPDYYWVSLIAPNFDWRCLCTCKTNVFARKRSFAKNFFLIMREMGHRPVFAKERLLLAFGTLSPSQFELQCKSKI